MVVDVNKVNYIDYFTADQDKETEFENNAMDKIMDEEELVTLVKRDVKSIWETKSKEAISYYNYYASGTEDNTKPKADQKGGTLFKVAMKPEDETRLRTVKEGGNSVVGHGLRVLDSMANGTKLSSAIVRRLSEGVDPTTGQTLNAKTKSYFDKARRYPEKLINKNGDPIQVPRLGYDVTFSIDKDVSVLWAELKVIAERSRSNSMSDLISKIENLIETSAAKAIQLMYDSGQFRTRRTISSQYVCEETGKTKTKRTEYSEPILDLTSALYLHKTARPTGNGTSNGDPQLHVHALLFNSVIRQDGTIGALDSSNLHRMRPVMDAAFKAAFYEGLVEIEELKHLDIIKKDKSIEIGGFTQEIREAFSSRREEIKDELEEQGLDISNRMAASVAAKKTRGSKNDQPGVAELLPEWDQKIRELTKDVGIYKLTQEHARKVAEETHEQKLERLAQETISRIGEHQTIVSERDLIAEAMRACCGERGVGYKGVPEVIKYIKDTHLLIAEPDTNQEIQWAILHLAEKEVQFLLDIRNAEKMKPISSDAEIKAQMDTVMAAHYADPENVRMPNEGQIGMHNYVLSSEDQVICVEGSAGTGKTTTMQLINEAMGKAGLNAYGISPSWKAAGGLGNELGLPDDKFFAITKFINSLKSYTDPDTGRIRAAKIQLTSKDVVIVDEAGMMGIEDAQFLVQEVKKAGARLIMLGDTLQLAPVAAGDPLSMAIRVNGGFRLDTIVRQSDNSNEETKRLTARMREASAAFVDSGKSGGIGKNAEGSHNDPSSGKKGKAGDPNIAKALGIYYDEGRIKFAKDAKSTFHLVADRYMHFVDLEKGNLREILVVTNRNKDVHTSNFYIRRELIKVGTLGKKEIIVKAYRRDEKDDTIGHDLKIRANERVIFGGKQLVIDGFTINNSDMATVLEVEPGKGNSEPTMTLRFDKTDKHDAFTITVTPSQLAADDRMSDRMPRPVLQHAYAVTVHASQGATVNRAIVANVNGIDYRLAYVGLTRHRKDAEMIVNIGRMELNAMVNDGLIIREENGDLIIPHPEGKEDIVIPEDEYKLTEDDYMNRLVFEASQAEFKSNFTGLSMYRTREELETFLDDPDRFVTHLQKLQAQGRLDEEDLRKRIIDNKARLQGDLHKVSGTMSNAMASTLSEALVAKLKEIVVESDASLNAIQNGKPSIVKMLPKLTTTLNTPTAPTKEALDELKRSYSMTDELTNKMTMDVSAFKSKDFKWNNEIEETYRDNLEAFMLANGAVQNPKLKNSKFKLNFCDHLVKGEPKNTYTMSLLTDNNWIYSQWNDSTQKGVLENWLVKKGVCQDYKAASAMLAAEFPLHLVRSAKLKDQEFDNRLIKDAKPKDIKGAYTHGVKEQLAVTSFANKGYGDIDPLENLHDAIEQSRLPSAFGDVKKRGDVASKWLAIIRKIEEPDATENERKQGQAAYDVLMAGGSFPEYEWNNKLERVRETDVYFKQRCIDSYTIKFFENDVRRYAFLDYSSEMPEWKDGLAFAHCNVDYWKQITGIETKMAEATTRSGKEALKSSFSSHPGKGLAMLGEKMNPTKIVICESGLDAMSHWQKHNLPAEFDDWRVTKKREWLEKAKSENDILYLSVAGSISSVALDGISRLAQKFPNAKFEMAFDNDFAGFCFQEKAKAAALAGNKNAQIEDSKLPIFLKDWNDLAKAERQKFGQQVELQWPGNISAEFVSKSFNMAINKPVELTKVSESFLKRFTDENLYQEALKFVQENPVIMVRIQAYVDDRKTKTAADVKSWTPELFRDAKNPCGYQQGHLEFILAARKEAVERNSYGYFLKKTDDSQKIGDVAQVTSVTKTSFNSHFMRPPMQPMVKAKEDVERPAQQAKGFTRPPARTAFGRPVADTSTQKLAEQRAAERSIQKQKAVEEMRRQQEIDKEKNSAGVMKI